jgi:hypothetical protein
VVARRPSSKPVSASRKVLAQDAASAAPVACARAQHVDRAPAHRALQLRLQFVRRRRSKTGDDDEFDSAQIDVCLRRDPQRTVVTLNGGTRFAALIRLAVANTSWVMAALEAMHPSISTTATLVMSKNTRLMSILTLAQRREIATISVKASPLCRGL